MSPRISRIARGAAAATLATFVALTSHIWGGGTMPGWLGIVAPWVLSLAVCTVLAGRKVSAIRLTLAVGVSQVLFHSLFVLGTVSAAPASSDATSHHATAASISATAHDSSDHLGADPSMWAAHVVAALVTAAALYFGERAIRALLRLASLVVTWAEKLLAARTVRVTVLPSALEQEFPDVPAIVSRVASSPVHSRGPPRLAFA